MQEPFTIGSYLFIRYLGQGGMAAVWEASHSHLDLGRLAIKFPLDEYAANEELQRRFLVEAKIESKLHHPNIVRVQDFFQADGRSYMVMAFVEPPRALDDTDDLHAMPLNLEERLRRRPALTLAEVHTFATDVLNALAYAHGAHVVHRDIKPSNIMLAHDGHAVLTDFGIAKILDATQSSALTGRSIGTPDYMSPEQITAPQTVDARTDIYSFGCVLYAMLSGDPPFAANAATEFSIKYAHVHEPPPPLVWAGAPMPRAIQDVVFRCLAKNPADRFQTCAEVAQALTAAIHPPRQTIIDPAPVVLAPPPPVVETPNGVKPIPPRPKTVVPPSRRRGWIVAMAGVALLIVAALLFGYLHGRPAPADPRPFVPHSTPDTGSTAPKPDGPHQVSPPPQVRGTKKTGPGTVKPPQPDPEDDCNKAKRRKEGLLGPCLRQNN